MQHCCTQKYIQKEFYYFYYLVNIHSMCSQEKLKQQTSTGVVSFYNIKGTTFFWTGFMAKRDNKIEKSIYDS